MDAKLLSSLAGILISLLFAYAPGLKEWYDKQTSPNKGLVMLAALGVVAVVAYVLACMKWFKVPVSCDQAGIETLIEAFILALVANQATFLTVVRPGKVQ